MVVYNITIKILPEIEEEWLEWQHTEHIPGVMASGKFSGYRFFRLMDQEEDDGLTFVIQYFADNRADYDEYIYKFAPALRDEAIARWGDRFIAFRTIMEEIPSKG